MANKFTGITSAGVNVPVYDKEAHQALENVYTKSEVDTELNTKQDNLSTEQLYNIDNALTTSAGLASEAWVNDQGFAKESDIPTTAGLMEESKLNIEDNHITAYNGIPFSAEGGGGGATYEGVAPIVVDNTENKISADTIDVNYQQITHDDSLVHVSNDAQYALGVNLPMFNNWVNVTNEITFDSVFTVKPEVYYNAALKLIFISGVFNVKSATTSWVNHGSFPIKYAPVVEGIQIYNQSSQLSNYSIVQLWLDSTGVLKVRSSSTNELITSVAIIYPCKGGV